jgi:hypothetical protein
MTIFHFKDTPENRAHADAINGIMKRKADLAKAETTHMKSKAALPLLLGGSAFALCLGVGGGVALWGYSYITGNKVIAGQVAESVKAVLDKEVITTKGTVTLAGGSEVALAKGGQVGIDPDSVVRVVGQAPDMPRSSPEQVQTVAGAAPNEAASSWLNVHKMIEFESGWVQSDWSYRTSNAQKPYRQGCMYFENVGEDLRRSVSLERNGQRVALANPSPPSLASI